MRVLAEYTPLQQWIAITVGTVLGMGLGGAILLFTRAQTIGWLLFVLAFAIWMVAALHALAWGWETIYR